MKGAAPVEVELPESVGPADAPTGGISAAGEQAVDGRTARSAKTRTAIADALLDLLAEGRLRPTAKEIAERADVAVRTLYVHFDDLEDLFCVAADRHFKRLTPLLKAAAATGSLAERAEAVARQRSRLYDATGSIGRATRLHAAFSPTLARVLRDAHALSRTDLERVFALELNRLDDPGRARTVALLDVLTGPDTWLNLRDAHDLDVDDALRCVIDSIVVHLETVPT